MAQFDNDNFLRACWRKETDYTPVWFMRQAGRYLESYQRIRAKHDVLTICKTPELSAKIATDAVSELGVDAGILFADIMLPLEGIGVKLKLVDGVGPVIERPVETKEQIETLSGFSPEQHVPYVLQAVRLIKQQLGETLPLIGFSGAPFTLASYLIEGSPSREFTRTKKLMYDQPDPWKLLLSKLSQIVATYLHAQVRAGVDAVMLFDSWSGCLSPSDYRDFVLPYNQKILADLSGNDVPRILFGVGTAGILDEMRKTESDVFGVDWRLPIDNAWRVIGETAIQGNLDPATLLASDKLIEERTKDILGRVGGKPGHIFNLGHGVLPETRPEKAKKLVRFVQESTRKRR
ncbi:MAG TPA: uroporphyrinogen decarboxylase [Candidatus Angelobacter sp.]|nr:uroporphyrinogen decarboxylase [Candidatus Angelobacter sp.]